jgi:hypothetical protein
MGKTKTKGQLLRNQYEILDLDDNNSDDDLQAPEQNTKKDDSVTQNSTGSGSSLKARLQAMQTDGPTGQGSQSVGARVPARRRQPRIVASKNDFSMRETDFPDIPDIRDKQTVTGGSAGLKGSWSKGVHTILAAKDLQPVQIEGPVKRVAKRYDYEDLPDYELEHLDITRLEGQANGSDRDVEDEWSCLWGM